MSLEASSSSALCTSDAAYQIQQQLNTLKKSTQDSGLELEKTRQMQEHHSINFYKHHQISGTEKQNSPIRVNLRTRRKKPKSLPIHIPMNMSEQAGFL